MSAAEAGDCWRNPKPCCSEGALSASRCPSRMSLSYSGASSLSPPARLAPFSLTSRYLCIYCKKQKREKGTPTFPSLQHSLLLVSNGQIRAKGQQQGHSGRSLRLLSHPRIHTCDINYDCRPGTHISWISGQGVTCHVFWAAL